MKVFKGDGVDQEFATLIQSSALLRALVKKGLITKEEVEAEIPDIVDEIKQTLLLAQAKENT